MQSFLTMGTTPCHEHWGLRKGFHTEICLPRGSGKQKWSLSWVCRAEGAEAPPEVGFLHGLRDGEVGFPSSRHYEVKPCVTWARRRWGG